MRNEAEIRTMFEALKQQRGTSVITNLYARALAWVLKDPQVEGLLLSKEAIALYECVS